MRRGFVAFFTLSLVGLGLTGCGLFRFEQREPWRSQAEEACLSQRMVQSSAYMALSSKIDGPGVCGMDYPFKVSAFTGGSVGLKSKVTLACPIIPRIDTWLDEVVKPAALLYFGVPVVDLKAGSYSCRPRNNQRGAKLSEHAFGNALDVMGFVLADGREITVVKGWRGAPAEQDFLREAFVGACSYFTTVLAPGSDAFHYDHLHIDLARHDPHGKRSICKPVLKFTPRIDPRLAGQARSGPASQGMASQGLTSQGLTSHGTAYQGMPSRDMNRAGDLSPIDMEQDIAEEGYAADLPGPGGPAQTFAPPQPSPYQRPQAGRPLALTGAGLY